MKDWQNYLPDKEPNFTKKKKNKGPGCKRNKIGKNRYGYCSFNEKDECIYCKRPRRKVLRMDPVTNTIIIEYFE